MYFSTNRFYWHGICIIYISNCTHYKLLAEVFYFFNILKILMLRTISVFLCILAVSLVATDAYAAGRFRIGVTGSLATVYDDNVELSHTDKIADVITRIGVGVVLKKEDKTSETRIGLGAEGSIYAHNSDFNNISPMADLLWKKELTGTQRLTMEDRFRLSYEPTDFADAFGRESGQYGHYANRFRLAFEQDLRPQLTFDTFFENDIDFFTTTEEEDSIANRAGLGLHFALSSANVVGMMYEFSMRDFVDDADGSTHLLAGTWRHFFSPRLSLETRAGGQGVRDFDDETYVRPYGALILTHDVGEETVATLSLFKEEVMDPYTIAVAESWRCEARLERDMSERLTGSLAWFFGGRDYRTPDPSEEFIGVSVGLGYEIAPDWESGLFYTYATTDSDDESRSYVRNVVTLKATRIF